MTEHKTLVAALISARKSFKPILKTSTNPHFRSKYSDLASVLEAVGPALTANGIDWWQTPVVIEGKDYMRTTLEHVSGDKRVGEWPILMSKNDAQGFGGGSTYARRYALLAILGEASEDDDGNVAVEAAPAQASYSKTPAKKPEKTLADIKAGDVNPVTGETTMTMELDACKTIEAIDAWVMKWADQIPPEAKQPYRDAVKKLKASIAAKEA